MIKLKAWIIRAKHHFYNEGQNIILNKIRFNNNKNQLMCVRKSVKGKQNWNPLRRQKIIKKSSAPFYIFLIQKRYPYSELFIHTKHSEIQAERNIYHHENMLSKIYLQIT